jgi:glutamyl-tRNA synthetase
MTVRLRFAPSPTGFLHAGNARTALINWLFAKHHKGVFILRLDDTDLERSKREFEEGIYEDLKWLGLIHDEFFKQSDRLERYGQATESLKAAGRLYPCYETEEELTFKRRAQLARGVPPKYDRASLNLTQEQIAAHEAEGRKPHWRFRLNHGTIEWADLAHGTLSFDADNLTDPILVREDGSPVYTLSSVVDDIDSTITHIIRGDDHITNTAIQIQLFQALGKNIETLYFGHLPLISGEQGENLSKRLGSISLRNFREDHLDPMSINSYLAKLGTSEEILPYTTLQELANTFDISKFGHASPRFSVEMLKRINEKLLHLMPYAIAKQKLESNGYTMIDESFWQTYQSNLLIIDDIKKLYDICYGTITPVKQDASFIRAALETAPETPWDEGTWSTWSSRIKEKTGLSGKALFMPLRLALTAEEHGPEMKKIILNIGRERAIHRLKEAAA